MVFDLLKSIFNYRISERRASSLIAGSMLSASTILLVVFIGQPSIFNIETMSKEGKQVGALITGMFGFAAMEAFRKSSN